MQSHHTSSDSSSCIQSYVACDWLSTAAEPLYAWPSRVIQQSTEHYARDYAQTVICSRPEENEWLLSTKTMMWWIIYVILSLFNYHTFIVKLYKYVTCWMCICVCMVRIEWKVNKIWYYHFKIWCLHIIWSNLWRKDLSCRDTLAWIQRCPLVTSFTVFSSNSYMCFPCKYYAGFIHTVTGSQPDSVANGVDTSIFQVYFSCILIYNS